MWLGTVQHVDTETKTIRTRAKTRFARPTQINEVVRNGGNVVVTTTTTRIRYIVNGVAASKARQK